MVDLVVKNRKCTLNNIPPKTKSNYVALLSEKRRKVLKKNWKLKRGIEKKRVTAGERKRLSKIKLGTERTTKENMGKEEVERE